MLTLRQSSRPFSPSNTDTGSDVSTPARREERGSEEGAQRAAEFQFVFGGDWLVAPVLEYGAASRAVYMPTLPPGEGWVSYYNGLNSTRIAGGQWLTVATPIDTFPLFFRSSLNVTAWGFRDEAAAAPEAAQALKIPA